MTNPEDTSPTVTEEAERLLSYWERHGEDPEAVAKWALPDMLGLLRMILGTEDDGFVSECGVTFDTARDVKDHQATCGACAGIEERNKE